MSDTPENPLPGTRPAPLHRPPRGQGVGLAPAMGGAAVCDGRLGWAAGRGLVDAAPATADTQYRIGSISKTFVAVLVMRLRDEGRVDLAEPLETYLPGTAAGDC